jgi:hypothetical protein
MMVGVGTFPSATALSLPGRADDGFAGLAATAVGFVGFVALDAAVDFGFAVAGLALNGAGSSSAGNGHSAKPFHRRLRRHKAATANQGCRQHANEKYSHSIPSPTRDCHWSIQ